MCLKTVSSNWASGEDDHVVGRAEYDFNALSEEEISFRAGDMLRLAPKGKLLILGLFPNHMRSKLYWKSLKIKMKKPQTLLFDQIPHPH